jgi:uncharacterized protein YlbG (UPF0298 family)
MEEHRDELKREYTTIEHYKNDFKITDELYAQLIAYGKKEGVSDSVSFNFSSRLARFVEVNKAKLDSIYRNIRDLEDVKMLDEMTTDFVKKSYQEAERLRNENRAPEFIKEYMKFEIARNIFSYGEAYQVFLESDDVCQKAIEAMRNEKLFKKFKVASN